MRKTAAEFLAELEANPAWVAARDERERVRQASEAELSRVEAELVEELRGVGLDVASAWDLVNNDPHPFLERPFVGPYERGYPILVRHLSRPYPARVREGIIRALTVRDGGPAVAEALFVAFERETDQALKWVLANALRVAMPYRQRRKHPEIAATLRNRE